MKKINLIIILLVGVFTLISCEKDETKVILGVGSAPALTAPTGGSSFVLTEETEQDIMTTFTWNAASFGYQAAISYTVQFDFAGDDFDTPNALGTTTEFELAVTVGEMNQKILLAEGVFGRINSLETRVMAVIQAIDKSGVDTLYSATVALDVTPYEVIIVYPSIFVPGNFQAASGYGSDWSPGDPLVAQLYAYSVTSPNKYEGYVYMAAGSNLFKFTDGPNWDLNWGDTGADGTLDQDGDNIEEANAGYYKINVDLGEMTYTYMDTDWGLIGSATPGGWDSDTDMTFDDVNHVWTITLDLVAGDIKFRANDLWDLNYGSDNANGICDAGGTNIPIAAAGNYTITLNLSGPLYRYTVVQN